MLWKLLKFMEDEGYGVAIDFVKRCKDCPIGHTNSVHKSGLAADIHLYDAEGRYLASGEEHKKFHNYWDSLGGAKRIDNDLNHYSLSHNGVR
jgi:hypothetical protein